MKVHDIRWNITKEFYFVIVFNKLETGDVL